MCDEIGWDFVDCITGSKTSFTFFCQRQTKTYKSNNQESHPFLSRSTFLSWWFAWLAAHNIDFRKDVDPLCGDSRNVLACDGTHVGVSLTNLNVTPIETPRNHAITIEPSHKRFDRVFLYYPKNSSKHCQENIRLARSHLRCVAADILGKPDRDLSDLSDEEILLRHELLLRVCPQDPACRSLLQSFLYAGNIPMEAQKSLASVFYILSGDAAVSNFIPLRFHEQLLEGCDALDGHVSPRALQLLDKMNDYCPEISHLLTRTKDTGIISDVIAFVRYLAQFVSELHDNDIPAIDPVPINGTYDPESGIAYYFTDHGCRVRDLPNYSLNNTRHYQDLYDDAPEQDICNKARVSPGGFNYTFFWFCPIHGHCLGFHLMPGAEGRRDPFSSLYSYLPQAPQEVFYDFACSFNEYSLNREPQYYRNTRFWHDLFHGYSHKCPSSLRSSRIPSLQGLDTSICEQFNSFLQNIKYTGSHLTQSHFCLYLQFMIHVWNRKKDIVFDNIANVALRVNYVNE